LKGLAFASQSGHGVIPPGAPLPLSTMSRHAPSMSPGLTPRTVEDGAQMAVQRRPTVLSAEGRSVRRPPGRAVLPFESLPNAQYLSQ
jgi:hypothetical protein